MPWWYRVDLLKSVHSCKFVTRGVVHTHVLKKVFKYLLLQQLVYMCTCIYMYVHVSATVNPALNAHILGFRALSEFDGDFAPDLGFRYTEDSPLRTSCRKKTSRFLIATKVGLKDATDLSHLLSLCTWDLINGK